ncbi:hypothetical protein FACS1894122_00890 [Alphaproteobacteria bacterium]|nr:hypothetical protein FACS1894122_00890 [Alphaproteobacteria bacterium]
MQHLVEAEHHKQLVVQHSVEAEHHKQLVVQHSVEAVVMKQLQEIEVPFLHDQQVC